MSYAIVTGASAGIGKEIAKRSIKKASLDDVFLDLTGQELRDT